MTAPFSPLLTRRQTLRLFSGAGLALCLNRWARAQSPLALASTSTPFVLESGSFSRLTPELTEGPYYIDLERIRPDITEGKAGIPLRLRIKVVQVTSGAPVPGAAVDVWHCDAEGIYSGFSTPLASPGGPGPNGSRGTRPGPPPNGFPPRGPGGFRGDPPVSNPDNSLTFLRGAQLTDQRGIAEIDTIFPGWYVGRATHIHLRVHTGGSVANGQYQAGHDSHTGQLFFPETVTADVYEQAPYANHNGTRVQLNDDGIFRDGGTEARIFPIDADHPERGFLCDSLLVIDARG